MPSAPARITDEDDNIYELWRDIRLEGSYDTTKKGVYELYYYLVDHSNQLSNRAKLVLVVQ